MLTDFYNYLLSSKLLPPKSKIILAVSGGVDSITLLHLLHNLRHQFSWDIIIAHYNHGVRADAFHDAILVGDLAQRYGYGFHLGKYEKNNFSEAALRQARYEFLEAIRRDSGFDFIATAHHSNDRIETAIFNTIRGADREGIPSLKCKNGNIVRPLLPFSKAEIIIFANLQNLPYREDSTNNNIHYSRNFIRNIILPHGSMRFRNFHHNFNKRLFELDDLNQKINVGLGKLSQTLVDYQDQQSLQLKKSKFTNLNQLIKSNLVIFLIKKLTNPHKLNRKNVNSIIEFIENSDSGDRLDLPGGLHIINNYDTVIFTSNLKAFSGKADQQVRPLTKTKPFINGLFKIVLTNSINNKDHVKIPEMKLYVRYRLDGDKIYPVGMGGSKKLQDLFVDKKIPRYLRNLWPVVVNTKNEIVWVPKLARDRRFDKPARNYQFLSCEVR